MLFARRPRDYSLIGRTGSGLLKETFILSKYSLREYVLAFLFSVALLAIGFIAGRSSVEDCSVLTIPLSANLNTFHYDHRFGSVPSNLSDTAWEGIFPVQGGFFKHPSLAPRRSAFAVFHQLHCLDGIRQGYWETYQAALDGRKMRETEFSFMASPPHIRHCIDLLRQSLMCQPDTTIEVKDDELGGVTGFGTMHQCRSWDQLMDWVSKWQWYDYVPHPGKEDVSGHQHHSHAAE